jgi:hypothetical protein
LWQPAVKPWLAAHLYRTAGLVGKCAVADGKWLPCEASNTLRVTMPLMQYANRQDSYFLVRIKNILHFSTATCNKTQNIVLRHNLTAFCVTKFYFVH